MADTTLSIQIEVQAGELKRLRKEHDVLVRKIKGDWKTTSRRVQNDSSRMFKGLASGFKVVAASMAAMKLFQFGRSIVQVGVRMEGLRNGLLAVEGSTKAAAKALKEMQEIALLPGISLSQAIEARINLRAVKLEANLTNRAIKAMGNALAVVGKSDELTGVVLGMTQMASAGKVLQEEINQISSRIPQFRQAMKDAFGTARSEEIQKMGISVETFLRGTVEQLEKLPRVTKGAGAAISNLGNAFTMFADNIFKTFLPQFTATVDKMAKVVGKAADLIKGRQGGGISGIATPLLRERAKFASASDAFITNRAIGGGRFELDILTKQIRAEFRNAFFEVERNRLSQELVEVNALRRQFQTGSGVFAVERQGTSIRIPTGLRPKPKKGAGGVFPTLVPRQGRGGVNLGIPGRNAPRLGGPGSLPTVEPLLTSGAAVPFLIQSVPTPIPGVVPFGGDLDVFRTPVLRSGVERGFLPQVRGLTAEEARRNEALRLSRLPRTVPIGAQPFPGAETFKKGMKDISMSTLQATATITNAFANMAASMESSTLQIAASVIDMITRMLDAFGQGGKSGIGGALTSLGVGLGLSTGVGVAFAAVSGGIMVANTISNNQERNQSQRVQTRFLRTN